MILPDAHTYLPGNTPNRFLAWGTIAFPDENPPDAQSGIPLRFPWSPLNPAQQYVGIPNQARFPDSFSVDARVTKDFKVTDKYSVPLRRFRLQSDQSFQSRSAFTPILAIPPTASSSVNIAAATQPIST